MPVHEVLGVGIELGTANFHDNLKIVGKIWKRRIVKDVVLFFPRVDAPAKDKDNENILGIPFVDAGRRGDLVQASVAICAIIMQERGVRNMPERSPG
jgi:hypothetical protein